LQWGGENRMLLDMDRLVPSVGPGRGENESRITAVLGPTNTGKTHFAMERMLAHESGMIGFPLRLLARENYDRAVRVKGADAVALVTGEEKILPPRARYYLCTVEAMPLDRVRERGVDFLAIDEVQLGADPERGHVFTDRLLHARGRLETIVIGAETVRPLLRRILPDVEIIARPRFSRLAYAGPKKITRLPPRSAVIGFSAAEVYALAELMRRRRGGTAVVLGALSPRTRNAQVGLYQSGDVDYLVATDAIGMGLNMDIDHIAFARLAKFDGRMTRRLSPAELGQIAGRAGRHMNDGTFGTTAGELMSAETIQAVEQHDFDPLRFLYWRNPDLDFSSLDDLIASLSIPPDDAAFVAAREAEDAATLVALAAVHDVRRKAESRAALALLWEVCQIPDFRKVMAEAHARFVGRLFHDLTAPAGRIRSDWIARQVERIDKPEGDIGTLVGRIAEIRTWTYVSYRVDWVEEALHWQERTRYVEDKLSDALHERLTERFVDKRTAVLLRRLHARDELLGGVRDDGEVLVEGLPVGRIEGFRFIAMADVLAEDARAVRAAAERALRQAFADRLARFEGAADEELALGDDGRIAWSGVPVGLLARGAHPLTPAVKTITEIGMDADLRERIRVRLAAWLGRFVARRYGPLAGRAPAEIKGAARGVVYQLAEALGTAPTAQLASLIASLSAEDRKALAKLGVRFGTEAVYLPRLQNGPTLKLGALLWAIFNGRALEALPELPNGPRAWIRTAAEWPDAFYRALGYCRTGAMALRADRMEALAAAARRLARQGAFAATPALAGAAGLPLKALPDALKALGYRHQPGEGGGTFSAAPQNRRARRRAGEPASANPCSPFARLKSLTARP
jgi:ATP-dependent RNA helicase SUPV3L1/SUV3